MGKKMLESEEVKEQIAKALVGGQSQAVIAQAVGVSQPTISRLVNKGDVKALIERESLKLLEAVPQIEKPVELVQSLDML